MASFQTLKKAEEEAHRLVEEARQGIWLRSRLSFLLKFSLWLEFMFIVYRAHTAYESC